MKKILILIIIVICSLPSFAQDGFTLTFETENISGQSIELSFYYGSSDIAVSKNIVKIQEDKEIIKIEYDRKIFGAIYKLNLLGHNESVNIIIENGDNLSFKLNTPSIKSLIPLNSKKNVDFLSYEKNKDNQKLDEFMLKFPNSVATLFLNLEKKRKYIPVGFKERSLYQDTFWDDIDLNNSQLKFLPNIYKTINAYNKLIPINEKTYSKAFNIFFSKVDVNSRNLEFFLSYYYKNMNFYKSNNLDNVFINSYQKYFDTLKIEFKNEKNFRVIKNSYEDIVANPFGSKISDYVFYDLVDSAKSLSSIYSKNDYTFITFYDPDCHHCATAIPKLVSFFEKENALRSVDVETVAMINAYSLHKWKEFIEKNKMDGWINLYSDDPKKGYQKDFNCYSNPKYFLVDKNGNVLSRTGIPAELKKLIGR